ncbi:DivIVA domain-containing protein [Saccharomonospora amisosensis]|uniref:DivIVA domain-containing protein n=1 Tax=Saccharomonospora amisosensis TaxID=1128677 RepID=A0A7X5ZQ70_9PSEU|nr:DivIVA domain-containing protein [Saccharomonospora amisosensis]
MKGVEQGFRGRWSVLLPQPSESELLRLRIEFDPALRGYDREQVRRYVEDTEAELRLLAADRDAALRRAEELVALVDDLRVRNRELQASLDRLCRTPPDPAVLPLHLSRMVELAQQEAAEIRNRAEAAAERTWAAARESAARLRARHERLLSELDRRRGELEQQQRELMREANRQVEELLAEAGRRRRELGEQAAAHRRQVRHDFEVAMAARRERAEREHADRAAAARAEAAEMVARAREEADRLLAAAEREATALRAVRDDAAARIASARGILTRAMPLLEPEPEPRPTRPPQSPQSPQRGGQPTAARESPATRAGTALAATA